MLANASPLSGLHKLAVTICARKKTPPCPPGVPTLDPTPSIGKENAGPVAPLLDISAAGVNSAKKSLVHGDTSVPDHSPGDCAGSCAAHVMCLFLLPLLKFCVRMGVHLMLDTLHQV